MGGQVRALEERICAFLHKKAPQRLWGRVAFWSLLATAVLFPLQFVPGVGGHVRGWAWLALVIWMFSSLPTVFRWMRWRLLWRLRNRLFVTYLLIGVTPIVLFSVLFGIAGYVLFGQFANFAATSEIDTQLLQLATNNESLALHVQNIFAGGGALKAANPADRSQATVSPTEMPPEVQVILKMPELRVGLYVDGHLQPSAIPAQHAFTSAASPPAWVKDGFRGLVLDRERIYFRSVTQERANGHVLTVITSLPLDSQFLGRVVGGLGRMTLWANIHLRSKLPSAAQAPGVEFHADGLPPNQPVIFTASSPAQHSGGRIGHRDLGQVSGGEFPKAGNIFDIAINFPTTLDATEWSTGNPTTIFALVTSRPSLLYQRLFRESVVIGSSIRAMLVLAAVVFACLELLAIFLASRLSRTITRSVSDLYHATREVDQGRLDYRIPVSRQDQLAALSRSFNTMSESLLRLLKEQKEKERLQSELAIAQEVQSNLFPAADVRVGGLELHGVCRPARSVSGDYYDFLALGEGGLCLAIGDISGKGISAALLMAGLHSAVRAYQFASEEMLADAELEGAPVPDGHAISPGAPRSPGNLLRLLNRHLYRSTQSAKYATLFLAYYDADTRVLRYSNGGQLPPIVLRADGSVVRLDRGGTVVGLLDNQRYEEGTLQLAPGDILVAYSDGVTEPENEYGDFGEDRLVELVHRNRHLPLPEIAQRVMQSLDDWIGGEEQPDDITLVLASQS